MSSVNSTILNITQKTTNIVANLHTETIIASILSTLILTGNSFILVLLWKYRKLRKRPYYCIAALTISDLCVGIIVPVNAFVVATKIIKKNFYICMSVYNLLVVCVLCSASFVFRKYLTNVRYV